MKPTQLLMTTQLSTDIPSQVSGFASLIDEYGSEVVLLAVFLFVVTILIAFMVFSNKKAQEHTQEMYNKNAEELRKIQENSSKVLQENFTLMLKALVDNNKSSEVHHDTSDTKPHGANQGREVGGEIAIQKIFKTESRKVLNELKCDRVAIYVFHNGNKSTFGYRFIKMSCIHEETINGTHTGRGVTAHQGIPVSAFSSIIDCLIGNDEYIVGNVYDHGIVSADEKILNFIAGSLVKSLFYRAIKDPNGEMIAFVVAEWNIEQDFSTATLYNKVRNALNTMGQSIYPIVTGEDIKSIIND